VCRIRKKRRWGADHIAYEVGLATSTVQNILNRAGLGRLDRGDRATDTEPVRRYQRDTPGELIHVDIKKLAAIPDGGGWKTRGRGYTGEGAKARRVGYRYIHTAIDDRSRIAYSEILTDEKGETAAGFWTRAAAWYVSIGITPQRVITDNGGCYRSSDWHKACETTRTTVKKTRPYRPQTNGKVERFHRILLEEWAYIRPWRSDLQRTRAYEGFIHFYNHHRSHGSLKWATPISILKDNVPEEHN
jgi:transposase InsO family protein